ncbi:hypothetical protein LSAT2_018162, partial [Lamellibrachia satsuma]
MCILDMWSKSTVPSDPPYPQIHCTLRSTIPIDPLYPQIYHTLRFIAPSD